MDLLILEASTELHWIVSVRYIQFRCAVALNWSLLLDWVRCAQGRAVHVQCLPVASLEDSEALRYRSRFDGQSSPVQGQPWPRCSLLSLSLSILFTCTLFFSPSFSVATFFFFLFLNFASTAHQRRHFLLSNSICLCLFIHMCPTRGQWSTFLTCASIAVHPLDMWSWFLVPSVLAL